MESNHKKQANHRKVKSTLPSTCSNQWEELSHLPIFLGLVNTKVEKNE